MDWELGSRMPHEAEPAWEASHRAVTSLVHQAEMVW